jgi:hypothetical protein
MGMADIHAGGDKAARMEYYGRPKPTTTTAASSVGFFAVALLLWVCLSAFCQRLVPKPANNEAHVAPLAPLRLR